MKINKTRLKANLKKAAPAIAYSVLAILVIGSNVAMIERFTRMPDGSHNFNI